MFEVLTWLDWSIIAVAIAALSGLIFYFRKHTYNEIIKEVEEVVIWVEQNMIHGSGAEKLEAAVVLVLERCVGKSFICRLMLKGLKANAGEKVINIIKDIIEKLNAFAKPDAIE